jgi:hypothetical protein
MPGGNFWLFRNGRGPQLSPVSIKIKRGKRDFHLRQCAPCREFANLENQIQPTQSYEKTSSTSIGSNRTGLGSGKTD